MSPTALFGYDLHADDELRPSVPQGGLPQIPADIERKFLLGEDAFLSAADEERCNAVIAEYKRQANERDLQRLRGQAPAAKSKIASKRWGRVPGDEPAQPLSDYAR